MGALLMLVCLVAVQQRTKIHFLFLMRLTIHTAVVCVSIVYCVCVCESADIVKIEGNKRQFLSQTSRTLKFMAHVRLVYLPHCIIYTKSRANKLRERQNMRYDSSAYQFSSASHNDASFKQQYARCGDWLISVFQSANKNRVFVV